MFSTRTGIAGLVFFAAMILYMSFFGSLAVDDQMGYIKYVQRGEIKLNPAHLLIEPSCLFFHRYLIFSGFSLEIITSIRLLNALSASSALSVLFVILDKHFSSRWTSIMIVAMAAISFNIFILAISAHPKLLSLPFQALSLLYLIRWAAAQEDDRRQRWLFAAALFLGLASLCLISIACITACIACYFLYVAIRYRQRRSWLPVVVFGAVGFVAPLAIAMAGAAATTGTSSGAKYYLAQLFDRFTLTSPLKPLLEVVQGLVYLRHFGSRVEYVMRGEIGAWNADLITSLVFNGIVYLLGITFLMVHVGRAWAGSSNGKYPRSLFWLPVVYIAGVVCFALIWDWAESEFYYPLTFPLLILVALSCHAADRPRARKICIWSVALFGIMLGAVNFRTYIPNRLYPRDRYGAMFRETLDESDIVICFPYYAGPEGPQVFHFPEIRKRKNTLNLFDVVWECKNRPYQFEWYMLKLLNTAMREGKKIYIFRLLDENDYDTPWKNVAFAGYTRREIQDFFTYRFRLKKLEMAEMDVWIVEGRDI